MKSSFSGYIVLLTVSVFVLLQTGCHSAANRQRISINTDWRFIQGDPASQTTNLTLLQVRSGGRGAPPATSQPVNDALWPYILASSNDFIKDPAKKIARPEAPFAIDGIPYASSAFDDNSWRRLDLPHDFGVDGQFLSPGTTGSNGGTGRLPCFGQVWYRKHLTLPASDSGRQIYLDIDGAMSYAIVFVNGQLVGGWPYGYASWRLDITPFVKVGQDNVIAIRLDNPPNSSRWYPGGGIYRNVWLTKTSPVAVGQWGTFITTPQVSADSASINFQVTVENKSRADAGVSIGTQIFLADKEGRRSGFPVAGIPAVNVSVKAGGSATADAKSTVANPKLWSPKSPNLYVAVTTLSQNGAVVDTYETLFGIRTVKFDPNAGMFINGELVEMNGVCDHHDLGALGAAVNYRALQRQLEILKDMGCNAIRTSHNPPAPELLELADKMGFVVMDEAFDTWRQTKTPNDYGRIFAQWHEQDMRMLVRRDRNHPSVVMWSIGNEIGEQGQGQAGANVAVELCQYVREEDPSRAITSAMNTARAGSPFAAAMDLVGLNYQGSRPPTPQYPLFRQSFSDKLVYGSETASTISSRGEYFFPVANFPGSTGGGRDNTVHQMSSYDLYYPSWATSPDTEFLSQDVFDYVTGEFVWTGFDYIGEPTPWGQGNDPSRSSYFGIIDLAGFPKDRFYIYQARWRPDLPMAHILPHWNWPDRVGLKDSAGNTVSTPVHVYTSGDEAELFLNGKSLGRKKKVFENAVDLRTGQPMQIAGKPINGMPAYRIRWDNVVYEPGELKVVAYKNGKQWATDTVKTTGPATKLALKPDRETIVGDGCDLSFVTLTVQDKDGLMVPRTNNPIKFEISGPGEIVATDNGDAADLTAFKSSERKAFNGLALAIVKAKPGQTGTIILTAKSEGLETASLVINTR